jgi:hypothetical protein
MGYIRALLFDNLGLKFVALLLAVLIYLNVYTDRPATMVVTFPLQLTDLPDTLSLSGPVPSSVEAELRGTGKELIRLRLREPVLKISLANVGAGHFERAIGTADLPLGGDSGPQVERLIGPLKLDIEIERRASRSVVVVARVEGMPALGHAWSGVWRAEPATIVLNGPRSVVSAIDSVSFGPVSIEGARDTVSVTAGALGLPDWCEADPAEVMVLVPIR